MSDIPDRIHKVLIQTIVKGLADKRLVLKGGGALMLAYNLDRYSEDIDYDSNTKIDLVPHLNNIMSNQHRIHYKITSKKHTDTTTRAYITYSTEKVKKAILKIETKNNCHIPSADIHSKPGFKVYTINKICGGKLHAASKRVKARDFYDLGFIANHHKQELTEQNLNNLEKLANNTSIHALYKKQWPKDRFVKNKSFNATITALNSVKTHIQNKDKESEYDLEL